MPLTDVHSNALLLELLNLLTDFDGQLPQHAIAILDELSSRADSIPPLYADVFRLPTWSTCSQLAKRIESLSAEQLAIASYVFQTFRSYEHMLKVDRTALSPEQQAASESQLERIRLKINRAKAVLAEAFESER